MVINRVLPHYSILGVGMLFTVKISKISLLILAASFVVLLVGPAAFSQDQPSSSRRSDRLQPELLRVPARIQQRPSVAAASMPSIEPVSQPNSPVGKTPTLAPLPKVELVNSEGQGSVDSNAVAKVSLEANSSRRSHRIPSDLVGSAIQPNSPSDSAMPLTVKNSPPAMELELNKRLESNSTVSMTDGETKGSKSQLVDDIGKKNLKSQLADSLSEQSQPLQPASSSDKATRVAGLVSRQDELKPIPPARVAKKLEPIRSAKPLPKLADPEQFRVTDGRKRFYQEFQEKVEANSSQQFTGKIPPSFQDKEASWLDNLPKPSLTSGVGAQPFQRAASNRETDALLAFSHQAALGMDYRMEQANVVKTWRSPNLSHRPIYFEDENLERYGIGYGRFQPLVSGTKFFATAIFLPYHVGVQHPSECVYEMGYFRPGDCNPAYGRQRELNRRGLFNQVMAFGFVFGGL